MSSSDNGFCTYGCNFLDQNPLAPRYIDHIMTRPPIYPFGNLRLRNTKVVLDQNIVPTQDGLVPLSDHFGLVTQVCLGNPNE